MISSRTCLHIPAAAFRHAGVTGCLGLFACGLFACGLSACATRRGEDLAGPPREHTSHARGDFTPAYTYLFVVHGDASYLYHDEEGNAHQGDEEVLDRIFEAAGALDGGEAHVFHQRSVRRFLLFRGGGESEYHLFRDGERVLREAYGRNVPEGGFDAEVEIFRRHATRPAGGTSRAPYTFFFYFGHQIPEFGGTGYHLSCPRTPFTIDVLADGLQGFRDAGLAGDRFDLVLLSACYGGTPGILLRTAPHARYVITSPDVLHLSHFDIRGFENPSSIERQGMRPFLRTAARLAFDRLRNTTRTAVTVALYDSEKIIELLERKRESIPGLAGEAVNGPGLLEYFDCADSPAHRVFSDAPGVDVFYSPPQFGRDRDKKSHSGFECWRVAPSP